MEAKGIVWACEKKCIGDNNNKDDVLETNGRETQDKMRCIRSLKIQKWRNTIEKGEEWNGIMNRAKNKNLYCTDVIVETRRNDFIKQMTSGAQ